MVLKPFLLTIDIKFVTKISHGPLAFLMKLSQRMQVKRIVNRHTQVA